MKKTNPLKTSLKAQSAASNSWFTNPIFSTTRVLDTAKAFFSEIGTKSGTKTRTKDHQNSFSKPFIHTGKLPARIPRGSTKLAELAKNRWYVFLVFYK